MRGATQCAKTLKSVLRTLKSKAGKATIPEFGEPIEQLMLGVLSRDQQESRAREILAELREHVVDYNELRVIPSLELREMLSDFPDARLKCEDINRALNRIFLLEHRVSLDRLASESRKDVIAYLEKIDGLEAYSRARIRLLGLKQPAFPLDEAMWAFARANEIVDPKCSLEEAQGFLERQIPEKDQLEVFALLRKQAWSEFGNAVKKGEVERIVSVPPDRTSRNMLQMVASGTIEPVAPDDADEDESDNLIDAEAFDAGGPDDGAGESAGGPGESGKRKSGRAKAAKPTPKKTKTKAAEPAAAKRTATPRAASGAGKAPRRSRAKNG